MSEEITKKDYVIPEITQEEIDEMISHIDAAKVIFKKYAVTLSPAERQRLVSSRVRNIGFIQASYLSAESHQNMLPAYIPISKYKNDKDYFERKHSLLSAVNGFAQEISDSLIISSDIVYHDSLAYYNTVKEAEKQHISGAETEFNKLKTYFARDKVKSSEPTVKKLERDFRSLLHGTKEGSIAVKKTIPKIEHTKIKIEDSVH
ncbi:MAG: hypothetical protein LBJ17_00610 [Dysgonamonadaceae bacterium]|jgi:hypothetical protein|nr:hypothetical protein [Dysgonamonadaceae bacterium]